MKVFAWGAGRGWWSLFFWWSLVIKVVHDQNEKSGKHLLKAIFGAFNVQFRAQLAPERRLQSGCQQQSKCWSCFRGREGPWEHWNLLGGSQEPSLVHKIYLGYFNMGGYIIYIYNIFIYIYMYILYVQYIYVCVCQGIFTITDCK